MNHYPFQWSRTLLACLSLLFLTTTFMYAQPPKPPTPVEVFLGHQQVNFQMVVKKKFAPVSKMSFFSVATFNADYPGGGDHFDIVIPVQLSYELGKGFGIMAGSNINSTVGFSPIIGPQYTYASPKFLVVSVLSFFLNEKKDIEFFGLYEFKPPLNEQWTLYNRLQILYVRNPTDGLHNRSYLYLRTGLQKEAFTFGLAANLDQYGPEMRYQDNFGLFVRWEFQ